MGKKKSLESDLEKEMEEEEEEGSEEMIEDDEEEEDEVIVEEEESSSSAEEEVVKKKRKKNGDDKLEKKKNKKMKNNNNEEEKAAKKMKKQEEKKNKKKSSSEEEGDVIKKKQKTVRKPARPHKNLTNEKLLSLLRQVRSKVEIEDVKLRTQIMRLRRYDNEMQFRGGFEAIGGKHEDGSVSIKKTIIDDMDEQDADMISKNY